MISRLDSPTDKNQNALYKSAVAQLETAPCYLVFELGYTGHYPHYIRHLANFWIKQYIPGKLTFVVSPQFAQHHAEVLQIGSALQPHRLQFEVISTADAEALIPRESPVKRARRSLQEWSLLRRYAQHFQATHCLLLYFDSFQTAALLKQPLPCPFSGIYFRPILHYSTFGQYSSTPKETVQEWREQFVLPQVLKHPKLKTLFCLDPFFVEFAHNKMQLSAPLELPDPVELLPAQANEEILGFKQQLGIEAHRITFLLFGALYDRRKGIDKVLQALDQLPVQACQKVCLLLVGQLDKENPIYEQIQQIQASGTVQIVIRDGFVPDEDVAMCFQATDIVLATYQRHVGMSGILVHAAAAQKPLIASDYGLLGELVDRRQLGMTVDSTAPAEIAIALQRCLNAPLEDLGNRAQMKAFAAENSAESFARSIFETLQTTADNSNSMVTSHA